MSFLTETVQTEQELTEKHTTREDIKISEFTDIETVRQKLKNIQKQHKLTKIMAKIREKQQLLDTALEHADLMNSDQTCNLTDSNKDSVTE